MKFLVAIILSVGLSPVLPEFYKNCNDSFIFSLKNGTIQTSILSRVIERNNAIKCSSGCGPIFGGIKGYDELVMFDNCDQVRKCYNRRASYEKRIRNESTFDGSGFSWFSVEEYEIFQISKKF
ncbi:hypothetical protein C2G38_638395 [Gigaspora rosea]|uniref:Uncharacterized protein n=1 Tax=Gigaspora rosea TaxID=44941 RepID=A0A397VXD1_9GLOM|nr:hypothetical protein C2G38_638395 [Gigaspora rosea]